MEQLLKKYYGKNYDKAMANAKEERIRIRNNFIKKYSNADLSKFEFDVDLNQDGIINSTSMYFKNSDVLSTDTTSDTSLNDKTMTRYLYSNTSKSGFPKIWKIGGTVQESPKGRRHVSFYGKEYYWDNFPIDYVLPYSINKFKVHVNNTDYFMCSLPPPHITTKNSAKWDVKESYYQSVVGTWIATYASGISRVFDFH